MTTTETIHGAGRPEATHCGLPFTANLRLSAKRSNVTCPACLTAMGEPRVVSGTDAGEGTVVKPDHVAVGQRWRYRSGGYTVIAGPDHHGWLTDWGDGDPVWFLAAEILADEYLGTVPAPAETPAPPGPKCKGCDGTGLETALGGYEEPCRLCVPLPPIAAAPPGPVKPPIHAAGFVADGGTKWGTHCGAPVATSLMAGASEATCPACLAKLGDAATPAPPGPVEPCYCNGGTEQRHTDGNMCPGVIAGAAPAPGVGEGAHGTWRDPKPGDKLTLHQATVYVDGAVEYLEIASSEWKPFDRSVPVAPGVVVNWQFRLKPAPAPKPGRVAELLNNFFAHREVIDVRLAKKLCRQVVDAHQEAVLNEACEECVRGQVIERARVALLGAEAGK